MRGTDNELRQKLINKLLKKQLDLEEWQQNQNVIEDVINHYYEHEIFENQLEIIMNQNFALQNQHIEKYYKERKRQYIDSFEKINPLEQRKQIATYDIQLINNLISGHVDLNHLDIYRYRLKFQDHIKFVSQIQHLDELRIGLGHMPGFGSDVGPDSKIAAGIVLEYKEYLVKFLREHEFPVIFNTDIKQVVSDIRALMIGNKISTTEDSNKPEFQPIRDEVRKEWKDYPDYKNYVNDKNFFEKFEMELFNHGIIDNDYNFIKKKNNNLTLSGLYLLLLENKHFRIKAFKNPSNPIEERHVRNYLDHRYNANMKDSIKKARKSEQKENLKSILWIKELFKIP